MRYGPRTLIHSLCPSGVAVTMCVQIINGNFAWITDEDRRRRYLTAVELLGKRIWGGAQELGDTV